MGKKRGTVTAFIFLGSKITVYGDERHEIKRQLFLGKSYDKPRKHMEKQRHDFVDKGPYGQSYVSVPWAARR